MACRGSLSCYEAKSLFIFAVKTSNKSSCFRFVPYKPGRYTVDVRCGGQSIENSPFVMKISEAETVSVKLKEFEKQVTSSFIIVYN